MSTVKQLNKLLKKYNIKGFKTKPKAKKQIIADLINTPYQNLREIAEKDYGVNIKKYKKKIYILQQIAKKIKKNIRENAIGNDITIEYDLFRFGRHIRVISKVNNLNDYYDRIEAYREKYADEQYDIRLVRAYFKPRNGNGRTLYRWINYGLYFGSKDLLSNWFDEINHTPNDIREGSDGIDDDKYIVDFSHFDLWLNQREQNGFGESFDNKFFKTIKLDKYEKNYCGLACLKIALGDMITKKIYDDEKLFSLQNLISFIQKNKYSIGIIGNYVSFIKKIDTNNLQLENFNKKKIMLYELKNIDIKVPILSKCEYLNTTPEYTIIYDHNKQHYEITKNIELDQIYCDKSAKFYKKINEEVLLINNIRDHNENLIEYGLIHNKQFDIEFIIMDYETITDWEDFNINKPYSLNILKCNLENLNYLNNLEIGYALSKNIIKNKDIKLLKELIDHLCLLDKITDTDEKDKYFEKNKNIEICVLADKLLKKCEILLEDFKIKFSILFTGFDCTAQLLKYIEKEQQNKRFYFVSFNGSNFDNYILYNDILKINPDYIGAPLIANGQMLNFKIFGRHEMFDVRKHVGGSLLQNCVSFKIDMCKKIEGFSHIEMQKKYDDDTLEDFIKISIKLKEYNTYDCLSLALVFYRYKIAIERIEGFQEYKVQNYLTISMLVNDKFNDHCIKNEIQLPKFYLTMDKYKKMGLDMLLKKPTIENKKIDLENINERYIQYYKDISKNRIAGRVELFNGRQKIKENLASLDVCSLYPYSMCVAPNYYPIGDIIEVKKYSEKPIDLLGYFYCDIDQTNIDINIMAEKSKNGNDWTAKHINNVFISSIMIDYLIEIGADVKIRNGIYFTGIVKGCKLFEFLLNVMKLKNEQDTFKENKSIEYNQVLREIFKLILNTLSGKLNQKLNQTERQIINSYEFIELQKNKKFDKLNTILVVGDKAHIIFDKDIDECIKNGKPVCVGSLIYDYSKIYMHKHMYTKIEKSKLIYTDTDSNKLRQEDFTKWRKYAENIIVPHWEEVEIYDPRYKEHKLFKNNSKVFGSFEDEYKDNNNDLSYFEQKKTYLCVNTREYYKLLKIKKLNKIDFSYFNLKNSYKQDHNLDIEKDIKKYASFHFKGVSDKDIILKDNVNNLTNKQLYEMFNDTNVKRIKDNYIEFFENLHVNKKSTILTCSLQRINNNLKKNVTMDDKDKLNKNCYSIISSYRIKNITIK